MRSSKEEEEEVEEKTNKVKYITKSTVEKDRKVTEGKSDAQIVLERLILKEGEIISKK